MSQRELDPRRYPSFGPWVRLKEWLNRLLDAVASRADEGHSTLTYEERQRRESARQAMQSVRGEWTGPYHDPPPGPMETNWPRYWLSLGLAFAGVLAAFATGIAAFFAVTAVGVVLGVAELLRERV